jgi:murein DD-endopeptidase MepM/ murein hydrolase activator NlpD
MGGTGLRAGADIGLGANSPWVAGGGDLLGKMLRWGLRRFPERQILVRAEGRVRYVTLTRRAQIAAASCGVAILALAAYGAAGSLPRENHAEQAAAPSAELAAQIEQLKRELAAVNAELAQSVSGTAQAQASAVVVAQNTAAVVAQSAASVQEADARIRALEEARDRAIAEQKELQQQLAQAQEAANARSQSLAQASRALEANRGELRQSDAQRQTLQGRVHQLETELEGANARSGQYKADLAINERKLQQLAAEHDRTTSERDRLQARLQELQARASVVSPIAPNAAESAPPAPTPQHSIADRPRDQRSENAPGPIGIGEIERVLASTGIDIEQLLGRLGSLPQGQGGPFVALDATRLAAAGARNEELQKILKTLPLASPLAHYTIESGFGGRADPFNHHQAFHSGVDMVAPYRSPICSTAPGVVIFTGVKENYGKVVEIDHGHGIVTRYAHLHRIVVARGQKLTAHQQVAELGSTGRSTGPHLHYEVLVNGTAQDPEKFLQAGKNVVQASGN